ncbi:MAG TPA: hypothetical protein DET40_19720 [Lentisphaeria bacterium]|nr:MAG: hypothetical protein A2X45_11165 [Lentisphaerae bacterium GWF2_50_93]HCE45778.1 hypothetical protein [Lentisphaeria bacterium]
MKNDCEKCIKKATDLLIKQLGPLEYSRFLSITQKKRMESLKQHKAWQATLDKETFFKKVF